MRVGAISCTPKFLLPNCFPYSSLARHPRAEPVGGQLCGIYRPKKAISHGNAPTIPRRFFLDTPTNGAIMLPNNGGHPPQHQPPAPPQFHSPDRLGTIASTAKEQDS